MRAVAEGARRRCDECTCLPPPPEKRVRKKKPKRVRADKRWKITKEERTAAARAERAVVVPRRSSRLPPPIDPLEGIATTWDLEAVCSVKPLVDAFWSRVQAEPRSRWN